MNANCFIIDHITGNALNRNEFVFKMSTPMTGLRCHNYNVTVIGISFPILKSAG